MKKQILLTVLAAAMGAAFVGCSSSSDNSAATDSETTQETEEAAETEQQTASPVTIQVTSASTSAGDEFNNPGDGKEYLIVNTEVANSGDEDVDVNTGYFKFLTDGVEYEATFASLDGVSEIENVTLKNGGKTSGDVVFAIPAGSTTGTLEFYTNVFDSDPAAAADVQF